MAARHLKIDLNKKHIDMAKNEHKTEAFLKVSFTEN